MKNFLKKKIPIKVQNSIQNSKHIGPKNFCATNCQNSKYIKQRNMKNCNRKKLKAKQNKNK